MSEDYTEAMYNAERYGRDKERRRVMAIIDAEREYIRDVHAFAWLAQLDKLAKAITEDKP